MVELLKGTSPDVPELHNPDIPRSLLSDAGLLELSTRLRDSQGVAAVLVHPFYVKNVTVWEIYTADYLSRHEAYLEQLPRAILEYRRRRFPIILFEEDKSLPLQDETLKRLGLDPKEVFLVPTKPHVPHPTTETLPGFSSKLFTHGLKKAIVAGSYMWMEPRGVVDPHSKIPPIPRVLNQNRMSGCAGYTIECFLDQGIQAIPAGASFPREQREKRYRRPIP